MTESGTASFDLVRQKIYPDSTGPSDVASFGYNRQGELTWFTDQIGNRHEYDYDDLARLLNDRLVEIGDLTDDSIRMIQRSYNTLGLLHTVSQSANHNPSAPDITDQVKFEYDAFGGLTKEWQEHDGEVHSGTPKVEYTYETSLENVARRLTMKYPNGRVIGFDHGTANSIDDLADRILYILDENAPLVEYMRRGIESTVRIQYLEPGIEMTYIRGLH